MPADTISNPSAKGLQQLLLAMADDEVILGHRDSEWTGYAPILEEDIAFSNIAQDEMGHALVWYSLLEPYSGRSPDQTAFGRPWSEFTCCRFVTYPKGDFAYTAVRQFLFDEAERVRLESLVGGGHPVLSTAAAKILMEEKYHLIHSKGLVERLGDATEESRKRMQEAVTVAFPQALGMFETLRNEEELVAEGTFPGNAALKRQWLGAVVPVFESVSLQIPVKREGENLVVMCAADEGGRQNQHTSHLKSLLEDFQQVYRSIPGANW